MCDLQSAMGGITKADVGVGLEGIGLGMRTMGDFYTAKSQKDILRSQATTADLNARLAELGAESALEAGARSAQAKMLERSQIRSAQRVGYAAGNVDLTSDAAINVMVSSDVLGEIDTNQIIANAAREAWGYRTQATNFSNEARSLRASSKAINPYVTAASTLLSGATSFSSRLDKLEKNRPSGNDRGTILASELPWQAPGNRKPGWMGGGTY